LEVVVVYSDEDYIGTKVARGDPLLTSARGGKMIPDATFDRWMYRGVRGIRLESVMIGGRRAVSRAALKRFVEAVSRSSVGGAPNRNQVNAQKEARAARVVKALGRRRARSGAVA
jgi:hypothetical protein